MNTINQLKIENNMIEMRDIFKEEDIGKVEAYDMIVMSKVYYDKFINNKKEYYEEI